MNIAIVGTGKVATILSEKLFNASHKIVCIVGRNETAVQTLANQYNSTGLSNFKQIPSQVDVILIAVADAAIAEIAENIANSNTIIVHTAGAISKEILNKNASNYGVLYPLQSITKYTTSTIEIPFLVDGSNDFTTNSIFKLAKTISTNVAFGSDELRSKIHIAAVLANNFTNYLFALAEDFCMNEQIDFSILQPIISETANRLKYISPKNVFTGPAIRKDEITINKHIELLEKHPTIKPLYIFLTKSLEEYYQNLGSK